MVNLEPDTFGFSSKSGPDTDTPMMDFMEMVMVGDDSNLKGVTTITWAILKHCHFDDVQYNFRDSGIFRF